MRAANILAFEKKTESLDDYNIMKRHGNWVLGLVVIVIAALWLGVVAVRTSAAAEPASEDSYDFSWLDPDKKIYVLQN